MSAVPTRLLGSLLNIRNGWAKSRSNCRRWCRS